MQTKSLLFLALRKIINYFLLFVFFVSTIFLSQAASPVMLGSYSRVYAPNTKDLNVIDTMALHAYCKLSKLFTSEASREKCFVSQKINTDDKSFQIADLENRVANYENELRDIKNIISATNTKDINSNITSEKSINTTRVINNTIVKYINNRTENNNTLIKNGSMATGMFNTILSEKAFVYGMNNKVYANASNTLTMGENINNNIPNSVQIGLNDNTKLTILGTTTENKNNGWVGLGGVTEPLNLNTCNTATNSNCFEKELLRVPGKIVARGFEVSGAADLAENFPADEDGLEAGYIVQFSDFTHSWNTGGSAKVSGDYQVSGVVKAIDNKKAIGVIATNPGVLLGGNTPNAVPVAFSGRVPVKVTDENGVVKKGDKIKVSATQNGYGAKLLLDGNVVGTALSDAKDGVVLILVKSEYVYTSENNSNKKLEGDICIDDVCLNKSILKKVVTFFNNFN